MANAERDANRVTTMLAVDSIDEVTPRNLQVDDSTGRLLVTATISGGGAGGTSATDDTAFTVGSGNGTPAMGLVTSDSVDSGDVGVLGMLTNRQLKVTLFDSGGSELSVGGGTQYTEDAAAAANPIGNALNLVRDDARGGSLTTTDGDNVAARGTNAGELYVKHVDSIPVTDNGGSLTVDAASLPLPTGAATSALQTQPGVDIGDVTINNASGGSAVNIQDGGNSITVDGSVTASGSKTNNNAAPTTDNIGVLPALVNASSPSFTEGNQTLLSINTTGNLRTTLNQVAGNAVATGNGASSTGVLRVAQVNDGTGVIATVGAVTAITNALPAGTNAIGKLAANSGVDIGDVDVTSSALPTGASTLAEQQTQTASLSVMDDWDNAASDGASVSGDVAHDSADAGEPVKIGAKAYSPDGTTPGTAVAENDRSNLKTDLDGSLFVRTTPATRGHKHLDGSSAYTDESIVADPGDGFQVVITNIVASTGAATALNFFLEEGSTKVFGPIYLEAVAGRGFASGPIHLPITASTAVTLTSSAAIAQSFDIDYYTQAV